MNNKIGILMAKMAGMIARLSPLFWTLFFLIITVLIWTNGGATSVSSETLGWKAIAALISSELSIGFLVAWILIQFVDKPAKIEAEKDFSEKQAVLSHNIFQYLYGVELPDELFQLIEDKVLKTPFYRRNYTAHYNFIRRIENSFLIRVNLECDVYNITEEARDYEIVGGIEKPAEAHNSISEPLGLTEIFIDNVPVSQDDIIEAIAAKPNTDDEVTFKHIHRIPAKGRINVKLTVWMAKHTRDYEIFRVLESSDSVKMKLFFSEPIDIKAAPIHPNQEFSHRHMSENSLSVDMDYPLAPHNGILLWWGEQGSNM